MAINRELVDGDWMPVKNSQSYREFLTAYLKVKNLSLSDLARASGFTRGFPGDVIAGKRRLTLKSYFAFEKSLKAPSLAKKMFKLLVALEEPKLFSDVSPETAQLELDQLRQKAWVKKRKMVSEAKSKPLAAMFRSGDLVSVYAASGLPGQLASFEDIQMRTGFDQAHLCSHLKRLTDLGLIKRIGEFYEPESLHVFVDAKSSSDLLADVFKRSAKSAASRVERAAQSEAEMFFSSSFCVQQNQLPKLKAALKETIQKFVDESIESQGDKVVHLLTALHL